MSWKVEDEPPISAMLFPWNSSSEPVLATSQVAVIDAQFPDS